MKARIYPIEESLLDWHESMQIKLFTKSNPSAQRGKLDRELEHEINGWLDRNPTIEIVNIAQSCASRGESQELVISVWYRPAAEVARQKLSRSADSSPPTHAG